MTQEALAAINDQGLRVGQCYDGTTAINAMLVSSSNDLSALLDAEAKEYGFSLDQYIFSRQWDMVIYDSSGFDFGDEQKISQGYAHDILMVAYEILVDYPSIADATTREAYPIADSAVQHTYARVADTSALRFAKTGYTALAGGNMMAIIEPAPGILIGIVVMRSGFLERFVDFEEIVSIIEYSYNLTH